MFRLSEAIERLLSWAVAVSNAREGSDYKGCFGKARKGVNSKAHV